MPSPDKKPQLGPALPQSPQPLPKKIGARPDDDPEAAVELARHVAQMTGEMASMARARGLDLLAYFLEMAKVEAQTCIRRDDELRS